MPFLHFRIAAWALLCAFVSCALPCAAFAAQNVGQFGSASAAEEAEEYPTPARLAPFRAAQTPPAVLQKSILEAVSKVEEEARLEVATEARVAAEQRARDELALSLKEQQEARENGRILREQRQARAKLIADAIKAAAPPLVAVIPAKKDWPLPKLVEDPSWNTPELAVFFKNTYSRADMEVLYRPLLKEAVNGNPRAMIVLAYAYKRWGGGISSSFSVMHPPMHNSDYWRRWALQLTSPDWVELRFGDVSLELEEKLSHYRAAALYRNSEAMYKVALMDDRPELLVEAALAGHPEAASLVAFNLGMGAEDFPASPGLASAYWWRGALAGDVRSMLVCSEFFYQGQNGFPKNERLAYLFGLLAFEEAQKRGGAALGLLPTAQRHLAGLGAALGLGSDDTWERRQDLEIFRAAPAEERLARLNAAAPAREAVLYALETELGPVRLVLDESGAGASERQLLSRLERAHADGDVEQLRLAMRLMDEQRQRDNYYFLCFGLLGLALILGGYLSMRLHFYSKVVRLVSVKEGGQS